MPNITIPSKQVSKQKVCFLVVNGFTLASLALGLLSIMCTMAGLLTSAAFCLLGCVALDGCDGNLARRWRVTSPFGAQLDSMADMTAFGIASAVLTYYWLIQKEPTLLIPVTVVSVLVALMSAIRLARFNVTPSNDAYFQGIPTTGATGIIVIIYLTSPHLYFAWALILVALVALLMGSLFPYVKLTQMRRIPWWLWVIVAGSALINLPATVLGVAAIYICSGPLLWIQQRQAA
ncbi:MAG: CDP-alcohol phosphatidyltransferase family protein [Chloroflexi bacterium]|nr:CDP-alcohol phosphatidyltransferase family protein [Chloroflexota bacterium]